MRMPELMQGHTMQVRERLTPRTMQLSLKLDGLSTANITLDAQAPELNAGDWVRVWLPDDSPMMAYVKQIQQDYRTGVRTVTLEHAAGLLSLAVLYGEWKPQSLGGNAKTVPIATAIRTVLTQQPTQVWQLGTCEATAEEGWSYTNATLYAAITGMLEAVEGCQLAYDFAALPWRLNIVRQPQDVAAEMRMGRNIATIKRTVSTTDMATRLYPVGLKNLSIASVNGGTPYIEQGVQNYGVIARTITDNSISDPALLLAWARKTLREYSTPTINVQLTGYDLSEATGEPLDKLTLGRRCRIPLPRYGATITERITELSYKDAVHAPEQVTVTIATRRKTIQHVLAQSQGGGGGGGKGSSAAQCELRDQGDRVEEIISSKLWQDKDVIGLMGGAFTAAYKDGQTTLTLKDGARMYVSRSGAAMEVVDAGNVVSCINATSEEIKIQAKRINLAGYVTATQLEAVSAKIDNLTSGNAKASYLNATTLHADTASIGTINRRVAAWRQLTINGSSYYVMIGLSGGS